MNYDISTAQIGDILCRQEQDTLKYYALQITHIFPDSVTILLLDYFEPTPPKADNLHQLAPFKEERWFFKKDSIVFKTVNKSSCPSGMHFVGNMPPLVTQESNCYGGWPWGKEHALESYWMDIPKEQRIKFKEALNDTSEVEVAGHTLRKTAGYIGDTLLEAMDDYSELDKLNAAYKYHATKWYPKLIPFLEGRWTAYQLELLNHQQQEVDLSRTHIRELIIEAKGLIALHLPDSCEKLSLISDIETKLQVFSSSKGKDIHLIIADNTPKDMGLNKLRTLYIRNVDGLNLQTLPHIYPYLQSLDLTGKPGSLQSIGTLKEFTKLEELHISDLFGYGADEFPNADELLHLNSLWLDSIPMDVGQKVRKQFKKHISNLSVQKLRKPEWLAENLYNPLRHWDGSEFVTPTQFKKSMKIYQESRRKALQLADNFTEERNITLLQEGLEELARSYADSFNKLDNKVYFIETEEREDLCMAFSEIVDSVLHQINGEDAVLDRVKIEDALDAARDW